MASITCPHKKYRCGIKSPEIPLYLGQTFQIEIDVSNNFSPDDSCYYHFFAGDLLTLAEDKYGFRSLQVYFNTIKGLEAFIGQADSPQGLSSDRKIDQYYYNFTVSNKEDFWITLQAEQGSSKGDFAAVITFSYYEYDPNCS